MDLCVESCTMRGQSCLAARHQSTQQCWTYVICYRLYSVNMMDLCVESCTMRGQSCLAARHQSTQQCWTYVICYRLYSVNMMDLCVESCTMRGQSCLAARQLELYYERTELFGSQTTVNTAVLDICDLLQASLWELRVLSTSKGLVAGNLTIVTADREVIDFSKPGGVLVPQDVNGILKIKSSAKFILIVEKDAAFQKLLDDGAHVRLGPCIIITGKGEPDINTRLFVCRLSRELAIPGLILVDADPYGIEIMCTYRFGSLTMIQHSAELAAPELRWVGLHPTDIQRLAIPTVPLTSLDFAKARELSRRPYIVQDEQLLEQVNWLLENGRKSEIENLTACSQTFLTDMFLPHKITARNVI
ncbi:meiotic recombination protein SPO11-like [Macrosteles quadrilineatus]|uniref:meiotic recombination protein SPO11-like n=1 Tax=Macrosteles quadrilineatus TaxID=74068 RepID=UPI0023E157E0|nr:meiotic recombination protein SPO11-like [Macrosteles quadrilineatus]